MRFRGDRETTEVLSLLLAALAFAATIATWRGGGPRDEETWGVALVPLVAGAGFLSGLILQILGSPRLGWIRGFWLAGSALLATAAILFAEVASGRRLAFGYWLPAALAMASAVMLRPEEKKPLTV